MKRSLYCLAIFGIALGVFSLANITKVSAATATWNGSSSPDWNDDANWDSPPQEEDLLVFPEAPGGFTADLDCGDASIIYGGITFEGEYSVSCPALHVRNYLNSVGAYDVSIDSDIIVYSEPASEFQNPFFFNSVSPDGELNFSGTIDLNGQWITFYTSTSGTINIDSDLIGTTTNLIIGGIGNTSFSGDANTFTGPLLLRGRLTLDVVNATGSSTNDLSVGVGPQPGILVSNIDGGVTSGTNVTVRNSSSWEIGNFEESPGSLAQGFFGRIILDTNGRLILGDLGGSFTTNNRFEGDGEIVKVGLGTLTLADDSTLFTGTVTVGAGALEVNADWSSGDIVLVGGSVVKGSGTVASIGGSGSGTVSPGVNDLGVLTVTGDITWNSTFIYEQELYGTTVGTEYDQLAVAGAVNLGGAELVLDLGYTPAIGDSFTIIHADGGINGTFANLPNLATFTLSGKRYQIRYTSTEVTLEVIPASSDSDPDSNSSSVSYNYISLAEVETDEPTEPSIDTPVAPTPTDPVIDEPELTNGEIVSGGPSINAVALLCLPLIALLVAAAYYSLRIKK